MEAVSDGPAGSCTATHPGEKTIPVFAEVELFCAAGNGRPAEEFPAILRNQRRRLRKSNK
jgi:hypothetical protein